MFFIFTKKEKEKKIIINENNECLLCLESNNKVFYDYDYENNKYIHNCICKPNVHYLCFKENYEIKENCIICLINIDKKPKKDIIYYLMYLLKIKLIVLLFILLYSLYSLFIDFDIIYLHLENEDIQNLFIQDEGEYYE